MSTTQVCWITPARTQYERRRLKQKARNGIMLKAETPFELENQCSFLYCPVRTENEAIARVVKTKCSKQRTKTKSRLFQL